MSALIPVDESGKNKNKRFQNRARDPVHFPIIPLSHLSPQKLSTLLYCPDEFELDYPCKDKSKDTTDFSEWSYFKQQVPARYQTRRKDETHARYAARRHRTAQQEDIADNQGNADTRANANDYTTHMETKVVSRKSCASWSPELLRKLRQPMKTDREYLAETAASKKKIPHPRKTRAQVLMEQLHPIREVSSDLFSMSASTESHMPRPRTPPEKISEEDLHRRFLEQQEADFQAGLKKMNAPSQQPADRVSRDESAAGSEMSMDVTES